VASVNVLKPLLHGSLGVKLLKNIWLATANLWRGGFSGDCFGFCSRDRFPSCGTGADGGQAAVGALILYGFKLNGLGRLDRKYLLSGGWALIVLLVILGQVWVNISDINL